MVLNLAANPRGVAKKSKGKEGEIEMVGDVVHFNFLVSRDLSRLALFFLMVLVLAALSRVLYTLIKKALVFSGSLFSRAFLYSLIAAL